MSPSDWTPAATGTELLCPEAGPTTRGALAERLVWDVSSLRC